MFGAIGGAMIGKAADSVGQVVNTAVTPFVDPDAKKGLDYEELVAPVQQNMRDKFPGLEMLMLPDQKHLVLHQKVEAAELIADMTNFGLDVIGFPIGVPGVETPNTYAVRSRDTGVTYYLIEEMSNGWESFMCRDCCRRNMPMKFSVKNMRTQEVVARIDSPCACDPCCCGCYWMPLPIPVCCCSRSATWNEIAASGTGGEAPDKKFLYDAETTREVASASLGCTCSDCGCSRKLDAQTADGTVHFSLFKRFCCCGRGGCFSSAELASDWNIIDDSHSWESPAGRIWLASWKQEYEPTNDRYPPLPKEGVGSFMVGLLKSLGKELFTDADTRLIEVPYDGADAKAALITAGIVSDYFYTE